MTDDICGIYLITNKINGHMYVGQSIDIHRRWRAHCALQDLDSSLVEKAIAKYGEENFSFDIIITLENDTEKLNDAEREWIAILNTYEDKNHYNQTPGGDFIPSKLPEVQAKMSAALSGENHPMYGKKHTQETREKISKAMSGENNPNYGKEGEEHPAYGYKHTPEAKAKMSKAISGENNPMKNPEIAAKRSGKNNPSYGGLSDEHREKISRVKNTTGFFRVYKNKNSAFKQGFTYVYQYHGDDKKRHRISSVSLEKLEQKVKAKGLEWFKLDDDDDNIFKIQESNKILYKIEGISPAGNFYSTHKNLNFNIHQVLKIKHKILDKEVTIAKAKEIATNIGISYEVMQRIAYNLTAGIFDKYIADWKARLANTL